MIQMTGYIFIVNPEARGGKVAKLWVKTEEYAKSLDLDFEVVHTEHIDHAIDLARDSGSKNDIRVAVGGDGTAQEVANGCIQSDTSMTLFPLGNGNDYARNFDFSSDPIKSVDSLVNRKLIEVSVMEAEKDGEKRYAINHISLGVSGAVAESKLRGEGKWLLGHAKYQYLAFKNLIKWKNPGSRIIVDGEEIKFNLSLLVMGLGYSFGAGYKVLPDASPDQDKMHVIWADNLPRRKMPGVMGLLQKGTHIAHPQIYHRTAKEIIVECDEDITAELEGEWLRKTPIKLRVANEKLKILAIPESEIYKRVTNR